VWDSKVRVTVTARPDSSGFCRSAEHIPIVPGYAVLHIMTGFGCLTLGIESTGGIMEA